MNPCMSRALVWCLEFARECGWMPTSQGAKRLTLTLRTSHIRALPALHLHRAELPGLGHHRAQNTIDAGRIALAIVLEPVVDIPVQAGGHQHLSRPAQPRHFLTPPRSDVPPIASS